MPTWYRRFSAPLLALALCLPAGARPPMQADTLNVCFDEWSPYATYQGREGYKGLTLERMRDIFAGFGIALRFHSSNMSRCLAEGKAGAVQIILYAAPSILPGWKTGTVPTEFWLIGAWVRPEATWQHYEDLGQFSGARVALVTDYDYTPDILQKHDWQMHRVVDALDALHEVHARRVDVAFDDLFWVRRMAGEHHLQLRMLQPLVKVSPQYAIYQAKYAELFGRYEREIQARIDSGEMERQYHEALGISFAALQKGDYAGVFDAKP